MAWIVEAFIKICLFIMNLQETYWTLLFYAIYFLMFTMQSYEPFSQTLLHFHTNFYFGWSLSFF